MQTIFGSSSRVSSRPLHDQDGVVLDERPVLGHGLGEDEDLHGGLQVLEDEAGHQVALLRVGPAQVGHHAPDRAHRRPRSPAAGSSSRMSERRAVGVAGQRRLEAHQRVVAHVEAEHLLLEGQALRLVELGVGDGDLGPAPARVGLLLLEGGEERW